jgi:hypothetical protein
MAAKAKENRALTNSLINQLREIQEVAQSPTEQSALQALLKRRFARAQSIFEKFEPLHSAIIAYVPTQPEFDLEAEEQIWIEFFEAFDQIDAAYVRYFPEVERPACSPNSINVFELTVAKIIITYCYVLKNS